jgi:hypothetical protein
MMRFISRGFLNELLYPGVGVDFRWLSRDENILAQSIPISSRKQSCYVLSTAFFI